MCLVDALLPVVRALWVLPEHRLPMSKLLADECRERGQVLGRRRREEGGGTPAAANAVTTSTYVTFVGYQSGLGSPTQRTNSTAIGANSYVDADNRVVLGDGAVVDVWAGSAAQARLVGTGVRLVTGTRPTCDATTRGLLFYVAGGAGVADTCEVCRKDAANNYAWVSLF